MKYKDTLRIMIVLFLFSLPALAQPGGPDEDEDGENAPLDPVPIDDYLIPMLVLGVATGYYLIRKRKTVEK